MSDITTENNELFEKFMLDFKDEIKVLFLDFIKQNLNRENDVVVDKKKRGRPKKNTDVDNSKISIDQPKKRGRGRPKKDQVEQLKVTVVNDTDDDSTEANEEKKRGRPPLEEKEVDKVVFTTEQQEEEEEIDVIRIEINGTVYLRDSSNKLYSIDSQDYIGIHDIQTDMITVVA